MFETHFHKRPLGGNSKNDCHHLLDIAPLHRISYPPTFRPNT